MSTVQTHRPLVAGSVVLALIIALFAAGCGDDGQNATQPSTTTASPVTSEVVTAGTPTTNPGGTTEVPTTMSTGPVAAGLALEQVRNVQLDIGAGEEALSFALVDGSFQSGQGNDPGRVKVTLTGAPAFGDLDEDGVGDAAIAVRVQRGGGGADDGVTEYVVALLSQAGETFQAAYYQMSAGTRIQSVAVESGGVSVDAKVPGLEEWPGHAKVPVTAEFHLPVAMGAGRMLLLTSLTSETPGGDIRKISITSPEPESMVVGQVEITGTITIAPFENNLVYHVYDPSMNELAVGPVMVDAPDLGAPGTFSFFVDLMALGCLGSILVTVSDLSALDGSILALASVGLLNAAPT